MSTSPSANEDVIDVDEIEAVKAMKGVGEKVGDIHKPAAKWPCEGVLVAFPEGTNQHTSYPFGIHNEHLVPWDYWSIDDRFYLQAKSCQKFSSIAGGVCKNCHELTSSSLYTGIMARIRFGAHENIPLVYHGVGALMAITRWKTDQIEQLHMLKLNDSRKLLVKASMLKDHKQ